MSDKIITTLALGETFSISSDQLFKLYARAKFLVSIRNEMKPEIFLPGNPEYARVSRGYGHAFRALADIISEIDLSN